MQRTAPQTLQLLLAFLGRPDEWRYGYELSRVTGLRHGTLYPQLTRLEASGLLEGHWEEEGKGPGKPRHMYRLTEFGETAAAALLAQEGWL